MRIREILKTKAAYPLPKEFFRMKISRPRSIASKIPVSKESIVKFAKKFSGFIAKNPPPPGFAVFFENDLKIMLHHDRKRTRAAGSRPSRIAQKLERLLEGY